MEELIDGQRLQKLLATGGKGARDMFDLLFPALMRAEQVADDAAGVSDRAYKDYALARKVGWEWEPGKELAA